MNRDIVIQKYREFCGDGGGGFESDMLYLDVAVAEYELTADIYGRDRGVREEFKDSYIDLHNQIHLHWPPGYSAAEEKWSFLSWLVDYVDSDWRNATERPVCAIGAFGGFSDTFDDACYYAVTDWMRYRRYIGFRFGDAAISNREKAASVRIREGGLPPFTLTKKWIETTTTRTHQVKSAECMHFAALAADILMRNFPEAAMRNSNRVLEVVSNGMHNWVRFNLNRNSPRQIVDVDLWLGAMGNDVFYFNGQNHPLGLPTKTVFTYP